MKQNGQVTKSRKYDTICITFVSVKIRKDEENVNDKVQ